MNPGGLVLVAGGAYLAWWGYSKGKTAAVAQVGGLGTDVTKGTVAAVHAVGAGATGIHHFVQTAPVKVGGAAPHNPYATETIGGKKYHDVKNKAGKWVYAAGPAPSPHKAPKKVAKTPPKTTAHKKAPTEPIKAKAPGTGLIAL
jgi:hypothetical protein